VSLALLVGPANAGKVARLLDRYVAALDRGPFLVVPNRSDVDRVQRELLSRSPALLGGSIGTFDDLFERILTLAPGSRRPSLGPLQRRLVLSRAIGGTELGRLAASARFGGFAESLGDALAELEGALVEPGELPGEIGRLYGSYLDELERLGVWDAHLRAGRAAALLAAELEAWDGTPVFVYGFEDLTGARWAVLEALAGRSDVCVSLPYEPGRAAFTALERTAGDLAALAGAAVEELPARPWYDAPALAHLERALFDAEDADPPPLDGAVRFLEAAGTRAALELVGEEILGLLRAGAAPEDVGLVVPSGDRVRAPLETAFGALGIPYMLDAGLRLGRTPFGRALLGLARFVWLQGGRRELFAFLRSPYSGLARARADFVEGRLRGRAISSAERVEEETARHLGEPVGALSLLREAESPIEGIRALATTMLRGAWGLERPPVADAVELDLRAEEAVRRTLDELERFTGDVGPLTADEVVSALERTSVFRRAREPGRVVVCDLLRARTRRFAVVFVLGLEEGVLPRRVVDAPFLGEELRRGLETSGRGRRRLARADELSRDRYLFYTACTRPWRRLYLVREAATDDGRPLEPSPFYEEVRSRFDPADVERWTRRRPLSALAWELHRAPTERERIRSVAALAATDETSARLVASAGGWSRQLERALAAFDRPTRLANPRVLERLRATERFSVTELELFGDCSSMWFVERQVDPRPIDAEIDARLRGQVAHQTLYRFYDGLPKRFGTEAVEPDRVEDAIAFLLECLDHAIAGHVRLEVDELSLLELRAGLARDLEHFVRQDAALERRLVPRRFEVAFGSERAAPELQRGLDLGGFTVSGKIDRIDVDPFSARGIVQDYKSGIAHSARRIESDGRLQVPLYVLALRDLVGMEPLGGLYRSLSGEREARGMLRRDVRDDLPGLPAQDFLDEDEFWGTVDGATDRARVAVKRLRVGEVRHDPRWPGGCPAWCRNWPLCRVERA
jgi:ATP-dependent helicase/DNAse subunit B